MKDTRMRMSMRIMREALLILMLIIFISPVLQASPELSIQEEVRDIKFK